MEFGIKIDQFKKGFFDREAVIRKTNAATRRNLNRFGGRVRTIGRRSLRRRKRASAEGQPPSTHTSGNQNLKYILYGYDSVQQSVIVGPVKLNQKQQNWIDGGTLTVPEIHEEGAVVTIREVSSNNGRNWRRRDMRRSPRPWERYRSRRAIYVKRPFMLPAFNKAREGMDTDWRNSITN